MGRSEPWKIQKTVIPERFQPLQRIKFNTYRRYRPEYISPLPLLDLCSSVLEKEPLPECWFWTPNEVAEFIKQIGFPEYHDAFVDNLIDGRTLILVEADKLPKINIKNFDNMKIITKAIRELYPVDNDSHKRCINLPVRRPRTLYLWYKATRTGPIANAMTEPEYYRKIKLIRDETTEDRRYYALLNHWNRIPPYREWCPHVMIGLIRRINPMTGTTMRQNYKPKDHPYLLKDLCVYSLLCQDQTKKVKFNHRRSKFVNNESDFKNELNIVFIPQNVTSLLDLIKK